MITCALITDSRNRDNDIVFYVIIVQYSAGAEQNKLFGSHSNDFFKSSDTSRCPYSGQIESNICIFITDFVNGYHTICGIQFCYFFGTV